MRYFLGIDGGGTRTTAWLADEDGKVLARVEAGPSNPLKVGLRAAEREIRRATRTALRQAEVLKDGRGWSRARLLDAVCAGVAGIDRPAVYRPLFAWMRRHIPARHHLLTSDAAIALAAAVGDSPGILVNAGTGSIALLRDDRGHLLRAGGWGVPFDDLGSGYDLGCKGVTAALEAFDGRGSHTRLTERICRVLSLPDITEIVPKKLEPQEIAALSAQVIEAAQQGDLVACCLCDDAARDLANLAVALLKRAGWARRSVPVACTGGVFRSSHRIRHAFAREVRRFAPKARVELLARPPVEGALWLGRTHATARQWKASSRAGAGQRF
jgi:N-acetylglucosamine kinase-like BadF-type ATPase